MGYEWHSFLGDQLGGLQVFRNPRAHQHAGSRWILFRTSNSSSDGFASAAAALAYAKRLNPKLTWKRVPTLNTNH